MPQLNHVLTKYNAVKSKKINVTGTDITIVEYQDSDFISLTDMVKGFGDDSMIYSWMRNRNTLEFIGIWEEIHNPDFKGNEFVTFKSQAGLNTFNLTPRKWIEATNAIGIVSKAGRYGGGTFAHSDIAFKFAAWISAEFHTPPRFLTRGRWFSVSNAIKVLLFPGFNSLLETKNHEPLPDIRDRLLGNEGE